MIKQFVLYCVTAYSKQLELMLDGRIKLLNDLKQKVTAFRAQLVAEEQISQKIKRPAPARN
jgi:hypothetical protein